VPGYGLCAVTIFLSGAVVVRNMRITDAHYERTREQDNSRRAKAGPSHEKTQARNPGGPCRKSDPSVTVASKVRLPEEPVRPGRNRRAGRDLLRSEVHLAATPNCENESSSNVMTF
jgi:hypothetical protein